MHWFPPAEASLKRSHIKRLIYEIFEEQSCYSTSLLPVRSEQETGAQIGFSAKTCYGYSSNSTVNQGPNSFALPAASPPIVLRSHKELGFEGFKFYRVDMHGGSLSHGNYQQIDTLGKRNAMSPIEVTFISLLPTSLKHEIKQFASETLNHPCAHVYALRQ